MTSLSVRVAEDATKPLGYAVVTVGGLPKTLTTFEFALRRHGFADNCLGADGWQGPECWLTPEDAWYSGDSFKFLVGPDVVYQMESMPYELALRGQGMDGVAQTRFVWPLELDVEQGSGSAERQRVGGTKVNPAPASTGAMPPPIPPSAPVEASARQEMPPPLPPSARSEALPELETADINIPELTIPGYATPPPIPQTPPPAPTESIGATPPPLPRQTETVPPPLPDSTVPVAVKKPVQYPQGGEAPVETSVAEEAVEPLRSPPPTPVSAPRRGLGLPLIGLLAGGGVAAIAVAAWLLWPRGAGTLPSPVPTTVSVPPAPATQAQPAPTPPAPTATTKTPAVPHTPTQAPPATTATPQTAPTTTTRPTVEPPNPTITPPTPTVKTHSPPTTSTEMPAPTPSPTVTTRPPPTAPTEMPIPTPSPSEKRVIAPPPPVAPVEPSKPAPVVETTKPAAPPKPGAATKRDLESELKSQFESTIETELESTLKGKPPGARTPDRKPQ